MFQSCSPDLGGRPRGVEGLQLQTKLHVKW
jgi:hypothetical protein